MKIKNIYIPPGYLVVTVILVTIIAGSLLLSDDTSEQDTQPPTLTVISKNFTMYQGEQKQISIEYSDNTNVTEATLFYKRETDDNWQSTSILSKSYSFTVSSDETKNYYYYVTVNDQAENGPVGDPSTDGSRFYMITVLKNSNSDDGENIKRAVFVEEATATWCSNCPEASEAIHNSYEQQDIPFYYVSMVEDENQKAKNRLENEYNILGYPTIYLDGGYKVFVGSQNIIDNLDSSLREASNRPTPSIKLTLQSEWNETREELKNTIYINNFEDSTYTGTIKLYVTEIKSQWSDVNGDSYHFSFLDYGLNEEISISSGENKSISEVWNPSEKGFNVVKENLWVVAVLFDDEQHTGYSNPSEQDKEFDAYYVDATTASRVVEGTLPPTIGLKNPKPFYHYIRGNEAKNKLLSTTYVVGKMTIESNVESDLAVEKVIFQITGNRNNFSAEITQPPYEYTWDQLSFGKYTITVKVIDEQGRSDSDTIENVWAFIL